jgi:hypothetical protein
VSARLQARVHTRSVVIDANGIAAVTVTLDDFCTDKPLVLATLAPPFSNCDFDGTAELDDGEQIQVVSEATRRGVWVAATRRERLEGRKLTWRFRASNAYPFTRRDMVVPPKDYYQSLKTEHGGRSCVLRIRSGKLILSVRFESDEATLDPARVLIDELKPRWHGVGADWASVSEPGYVVTPMGRELRAEFNAPTEGRRYTIAPKLPELTTLAKDWQEAVQAVREVVSVRSSPDPKAPPVLDALSDMLHEQLAEQYRAPKPQGIAWAGSGFLWDDVGKVLRCAFGRTQAGQSPTCHYGEGLVGHAFRFDREMTYHGVHNPNLICTPNEARGWKICLPLRVRDTCVGVVAFAGDERPSDPIGVELFDLAAAKSLIHPEQRLALASLTWRLNCAFWRTIALSDFFASEQRQMAGQYLEHLAAAPTAVLNVPAKIGSKATTNGREQPATNGKRSAWRPWNSTRLWVAVIAAVGAVVVAYISRTPTAEKTLPPSPLREQMSVGEICSRPAITLTADQFLELLQGSAPKPTQLRQALWCGATLPSLEGRNLASRDLQDIPLSWAKLREADLRDALLQHAQLDNAELVDAQLDRAQLMAARLSGADLRSANLTHANLTYAIMNGARLDNANLSGADLRGARGLTAEQLRKACGDSSTRHDLDVELAPCPTSP